MKFNDVFKLKYGNWWSSFFKKCRRLWKLMETHENLKTFIETDGNSWKTKEEVHGN